MSDTAETTIARLLDAAMPHVPFDGWSAATYRAAVAEAGVDPALAATLCPRGAIDLALAFHTRGDAGMLKRIRETAMSDMRFRDRIAAAVRFRLEAIDDKEAARRATTLFALPQNAALGAKAIWGTADAIWTALGDTSTDYNWYTKRATLSGVYGSTVLFWLGDDCVDHQDTWAFLDRRIDDVMQIEKVKDRLRDNPALKPLMTGPNWILSKVRAPSKMPRMDIPGVFSTPDAGSEAKPEQ